MEKEILKTAKLAITEAIVKELTGYNKPLSKLTERVIEDNSASLYSLINDEFAGLLKSENFKEALKEALNAKLARTLISRMGGELEQQVNTLKANPATRAKIMVTINDLINS